VAGLPEHVRLVLEGTSVELLEEAKAWTGSDEAEASGLSIVVTVPTSAVADLRNGLLDGCGPDHLYRAVFPAGDDRAMPEVIRGKAFVEHNEWVASAAGRSLLLSALPSDFASPEQ